MHPCIEEDPDLEQYSQATAVTSARRYLHTAGGVLVAAAVLIAVALAASARVMGLKYTLRRVGSTANFAGVIFGIVLLVMCAVVARSTYFVPDAVTLDARAWFTHEAGQTSIPVSRCRLTSG